MTSSAAPKVIKLGRYERVIAVVPEYVSGPGFKNQIVSVHIVNFWDDSYRCECLQLDEINGTLGALFHPGAAMSQSLIAAVPVEKTK